ncbi:MAG: helix-turn-helix transcriptional regulator, partial [bacterium]|nr:helix-turn-helix transcriptional regulator [bacterium]
MESWRNRETAAALSKLDRLRKNTTLCPVQTTLEVLGGKWKVLILWHLRGERRRFGELKRLVPGITQKMLTS